MQKRKRVLLWAGLLVALAGAGLVGLVLLWPRPPINHEYFEKIHVGMSLQEVQEIFGVPAGDYSSGPITYEATFSPFCAPLGVVKQWIGDEGTAAVWFDASERVRCSEFRPASRTSETILARLRRWFGL